ncbi:hypothetical protein ACLMAJ_27760 [Nocardia sp. KC 131]|uniref:hypothetical protein n=1 Tax=Nocardia arseniciresistens TaxID=3392119 RepID=UPI00398EEA85
MPGTESTTYFAQVRDIAPQDWLFQRGEELAQLAAFCDGDEPYMWWRAGPWAGKTALMSWFALRPPEHVRVVSFFITSRLAAQADHAAFTSAQALIHVADALAEEYLGDNPEAGQALRRRINRLLAEIWSLGNQWYSPLDIVARLDPDLLSAITAEAIAGDGE